MVRVGLNLNAGTRAKMSRLARHRGYTITALVEELIKSAERRATSKLTGKAAEGLPRQRIDAASPTSTVMQ
jgi:hypothetical protein